MINGNNFLYIFSDLIHQKYPDVAPSEPSSKDYELADQMFVLLNQLLHSTELLTDHIVTLDFDEYDDCNPDYQEVNVIDTSPDVHGINYSYDTMCAIVKYSQTHTFTSVRRRYRQIKYKEQLRRIKQYVNAEGTKTQKLKQVDDSVYGEFLRARARYLPIHDSDLRRLASKKANELNIDGFTASHHWVSNFKCRHHISSRKVTKLVTKNHLEDRDKILQSAQNFVRTVVRIIPQFAEDHVLNSDQSSFKYVLKIQKEWN